MTYKTTTEPIEKTTPINVMQNITTGMRISKNNVTRSEAIIRYFERVRI